MKKMILVLLGMMFIGTTVLSTGCGSSSTDDDDSGSDDDDSAT